MDIFPHWHLVEKYMIGREIIARRHPAFSPGKDTLGTPAPHNEHLSSPTVYDEPLNTIEASAWGGRSNIEDVELDH